MADSGGCGSTPPPFVDVFAIHYAWTACVDALCIKLSAYNINTLKGHHFFRDAPELTYGDLRFKKNLQGKHPLLKSEGHFEGRGGKV